MEITEKGQKAIRLTAVIAVAGAVLFALWTVLLLPWNKQRRELEQAISNMKSQLVNEGYMLPQDILKSELQKEIRYGKALKSEWSNTVTRIAGFPRADRFTKIDYLKIDYRVALFDTTQRLHRKAQALGVSLPPDIGMDSAVRSNEDARQLMFQLMTVEQLLDMTLNLKIKTVKFIEPLPAIAHKFGGTGEAYMEEYPIKMQFYGNMEHLFAFLDSSLEGQAFFLLRQFRIEAPSETTADVLSISTVMSALLFIVPPEELTLSTLEPQKRRMGPAGH